MINLDLEHLVEDYTKSEDRRNLQKYGPQMTESSVGKNIIINVFIINYISSLNVVLGSVILEGFRTSISTLMESLPEQGFV